MAYTEKYYFRFDDIHGNSHNISIYQDDYSGSPIAIPFGDSDPLNLNYNGADKDKWETTHIFPVELVFSFYIPAADLSEFEDLFNAAYKEYKVIYTQESSNDIKFIGFVKPENLTRIYDKEQQNFNINISCTDVLSDLKSIPWTDSDERIIIGKISLLQAIKYALAKTNIELDFRIKIETFPIGGTWYNALSECFIDSRRFLDDNGLAMSCWDVIVNILKPFNARLKQVDGYYSIIKTRTVYTDTDYIYLWDTLEFVMGDSFNTVKVPTLFAAGIEHQKVRPIKEIQTIFRNKDFGGDVAAFDIMDSGKWTSSFNSISDIGEEFLLTDTGSWAAGTDEIITTDSFNVSKVTEEDYLKINFEHRGQLVRDSATPVPNYNIPYKVHVYIQRNGGTWEYVGLGTGNNKTAYFSSPITPILKIKNSSVDYRIRIAFYPLSTSWTYAIFNIKNITVNRLTNTTNPEEDRVAVLDTGYRQYNLDNNGFDKIEEEIIIGDGNFITEIGALLLEESGDYVLTNTWRRSSPSSDSGKLLDLYMRYILYSRHAFKNYFRMKIVDSSSLININNTISFDSKFYYILSYKKAIRLGIIEMELIEYPSGSGEFAPAIEFSLNSINGNSINNYVVNSNVPSQDIYLYNTGDIASGNYTFNGTLIFSGLSTGTDNTVLILNSSNQVVTDEIDSRVWGTSLVDFSTATTQYLSKWVDPNSLGNSQIYDNGTNVGIGTTTLNHFLTVNGNIGLPTSAYINFGATDGTSGYGIRDVGGNIAVKHSGGDWYKVPDVSGITTGRVLFVDSSTIASDSGLTYDSENNILTVSGYIVGSTGVRSPLIVGGQATTSDLVLQTTLGVGASGADMHFKVGNNGATEAMTILNDGKVGVGTITPGGTRLTVSYGFGGNDVLRLNDTDNISYATQYISYYYDSSLVAYIGYYNNVTTAFYLVNNGGNSLYLGTNGQTQTLRLISGEVGIGINPTTALHVYKNEASNYACIIEQDHASGYGLLVDIDGTKVQVLNAVGTYLNTTHETFLLSGGYTSGTGVTFFNYSMVSNRIYQVRVRLVCGDSSSVYMSTEIVFTYQYDMGYVAQQALVTHRSSAGVFISDASSGTTISIAVTSGSISGTFAYNAIVEVISSLNTII